FFPPKEISTTMMQAYYQAHKGDFITPQKITIAYVRLNIEDIKKNVNVSEEDMQQYYEDNQNNFKTPAAWHVQHILVSLSDEAATKAKAWELYHQLEKNPDQFTAFVKQYSNDKFSDSDTGELPWFHAGQTSFDKALMNFTKINSISIPVPTSQGYEIFKLIAYKPTVIQPFAKVKEIIHTQLQAEKAQSEYTQALDHLTDLSYQSPDTLKPVSETLHLAIQKTAPFTQQAPFPAGVTAEMAKAAFEKDVLTSGNNSEPIQVGNDSIVVLRVIHHEASQQQSFAEVETAIRAILEKNQSKEALQQWTDQWLHQPSLLAELNAHPLDWKSISASTLDGEEALSTIHKKAFSLSTKQPWGAVLLENGDYGLISLKEIHLARWDALDEEQKSNFKQQLESNDGIVLYELFIKNVMANADIQKK
ncbi:MAG: peptidyl-prolyl cis-trans isomerase, partial [Legionellaceae bacterium]|nr:peptidyl-prolyl cis-trans isomerase [Legionellaceae bacterium]